MFFIAVFATSIWAWNWEYLRFSAWRMRAILPNTFALMRALRIRAVAQKAVWPALRGAMSLKVRRREA